MKNILLGGFLTFFVLLGMATAIFVDTYAGDSSYITRIDVDPTGYGITLQQLQTKYSEFIKLEHVGSYWLFHFKKNPLGESQRDDFAMILESIKKVQSQYYATSDKIFVCNPEFITALGKYALTCSQLGS